MYKIVGLIGAILATEFYVWVLKTEIEDLKSKTSNLKKELEVCKSSSEAKEFEAKWSEEFRKAYNLNISDIEEKIGAEIEKNSTQNDSGEPVYSDSF